MFTTNDMQNPNSLTESNHPPVHNKEDPEPQQLKPSQKDKQQRNLQISLAKIFQTVLFYSSFLLVAKPFCKYSITYIGNFPQAISYVQLKT